MSGYPRKATYTVEYWDCGNGHQHKSQRVAERCIEKNKTKKPKANPWTIDRLMEVYQRKNAGESFRSLACEMGYRPETISEKYRKAKRINLANPDQLAILRKLEGKIHRGGRGVLYFLVAHKIASRPELIDILNGEPTNKDSFAVKNIRQTPEEFCQLMDLTSDHDYRLLYGWADTVRNHELGARR